MGFITKQDLGSAIYGYQIDQITDGDDNSVELAIAAAEDEVKSYLTGNHQKEWMDGRLHYNVEAIFAATGDDRNALIMGYVKTIAKWWLVELCNADIIYEQAKERYDRATSFLKDLAKGEITLKTLPLAEDNTSEDYVNTKPFSFGSRTKFNHE